MWHWLAALQFAMRLHRWLRREQPCACRWASLALICRHKSSTSSVHNMRTVARSAAHCVCNNEVHLCKIQITAGTRLSSRNERFPLSQNSCTHPTRSPTASSPSTSSRRTSSRRRSKCAVSRSRALYRHDAGLVSPPPRRRDAPSVASCAGRATSRMSPTPSRR